MAKLSFRPLGGRVLVSPIEQEEVTAMARNCSSCARATFSVLSVNPNRKKGSEPWLLNKLYFQKMLAVSLRTA